MAAIVLPLTYFGNISYFKFIVNNNDVWIDDQEIYLKQTFRNRTQLLAANGPINLSVPIISTKGIETSIKEIKISYDEQWQLKHWKTIKSAYKSAPFFEEYEEEIKALILKKHEFLIDLNFECLGTINNFLTINKCINLTSKEGVPANSKRFLGHFKPSKMPDLDFDSYMQVFNYKFGFVKNLSILDLLFNEGPYSNQYLTNNS